MVLDGVGSSGMRILRLAGSRNWNDVVNSGWLQGVGVGVGVAGVLVDLEVDGEGI